jgi:hypothetical protein
VRAWGAANCISCCGLRTQGLSQWAGSRPGPRSSGCTRSSCCCCRTCPPSRGHGPRCCCAGAKCVASRAAMRPKQGRRQATVVAAADGACTGWHCGASAAGACDLTSMCTARAACRSDPTPPPSCAAPALVLRLRTDCVARRPGVHCHWRLARHRARHRARSRQGGRAGARAPPWLPAAALHSCARVCTQSSGSSSSSSSSANAPASRPVHVTHHLNPAHIHHPAGHTRWPSTMRAAPTRRRR